MIPAGQFPEGRSEVLSRRRVVNRVGFGGSNTQGIAVVLAAAGEGAILAGQAEPQRECSMAVSGDSVA